MPEPRLHQRVDEEVDEHRHEGGAGDGEDPGDNDALAPDPPDGADAADGADAEDGTGDRVGGGDRDAADLGEAEDGEGGGGLGAKTADGREAGDARAHRLDDAPAAEDGAQG